MSLREELAVRFHGLALDKFDGDTYEFPERPVWLEVADECIRQMEWASAQAINRTITEPIVIDQNQFPGMCGVRIIGKRPLTAAPEDWSPK